RVIEDPPPVGRHRRHVSLLHLQAQAEASEEGLRQQQLNAGVDKSRWNVRFASHASLRLKNPARMRVLEATFGQDPAPVIDGEVALARKRNSCPFFRPAAPYWKLCVRCDDHSD